jgi:cobyrinic acid a,c-diamide synthase
VILTVNAKGAMTSLGAIIRGFKNFKQNSNIIGVIFNNTNSSTYTFLKEIAEKENVVSLGFMPDLEPFNCTFSSRHLGLITPAEISDLQKKMFQLGEIAEKNIDIDKLIKLCKSEKYRPEIKKLTQKKCRIAVAKDEAFCFIYNENIKILEDLGAEIVYFSPILDKKLPKNIGGLYICGGYPEVHLKPLSENKTMLESIKNAIEKCLPTVAECGGFMYLHKSIDDFEMCGIIDGEVEKTEKLQRFGYVKITSKKDNLLCKKGESINSHEFHYYESTANGADFTAFKPYSQRNWNCIHANENFWAGFPHLYFTSNPTFAENFIEKASNFKIEN